MARIVHVCATSAFARHVDRVLVALVNDGHDVHFISAPGPEPQRVLDRRVHLHTIGIERGIDLRSDLRALAQLSALLKSLEPDLVHAHTPKGGLLGMLAARLTRVPHRIYQIHGIRYETAQGAQRALLWSCERLTTSIAHNVICVSQSVRRRLILDSTVSESKAMVLANGSAQGIDLVEYETDRWWNLGRDFGRTLGIPAEAACVVYVGRLAGDKGLADLAVAWRRVAAENPDAHLILAGAPDTTDPANVDAFASIPRTHIVPHQDDPRPLIALARVVTLPSYREGLPQPILEAGAMGRPVVATRVTGVVDALVDGGGGILVPPKDPAALADALSSLLNDPQKARRMGERGRRFVGERFQWRPIVDKTMKLYRRMLAS